MDAVSFSAGENRIEVSVSFETEQSLPSAGDAYLVVNVQSNGFTGHNDLWVSKESLTEFCSSLASLERTLRGEAVLESISPGELLIRVAAVTERGHVAVSGQLGYRVNDENSRHWHSLQFGFEFEQAQLSEAASLAWVRQYAG
jgi:hypothetical protein